MKKILSILFIGIITMLNSCSLFEDDYIYIGYANSLDYDFGNLGVDTMYGVQLAVDEINELGGVDGKLIKLIIKGDDRDATKAVEIDNSLKELDVVAIIGHGYSLTAEAIAQNATENNILLISPTIATDSVTGIDDNFLRITSSARDQGYTLANAMHLTTPGDVVICYESINEAFSLEFVESFIERYEALGHFVSEDNIFTFEINESLDYQFVTSQIESLGISNVLAVGSAFDIGNILQVIENVENFNFYISAWTTTSDLLEMASKNVNNTIAISFFDFQSNNYKFMSLRHEYKERYGIDISYGSLLGYETMYLLKYALENTNDWSPSGLKKAILDTSSFTGITDSYRIDQYGDAHRKIYYYRIVNGENITIGSDDYD